MKKNSPIFIIERILKVHNSHRTIASFESYRDTVKSRAATTTTHQHRCALDGNELLRFHCASLSCSLGARGSTSLRLTSNSTTRLSTTPCGVCTIIRQGFSKNLNSVHGARTTASSGKEHDCGLTVAAEGCRAKLVCRVIAGRVRRASLFAKHTLSLTEALCGFKFVLTNLDNRQLLIKYGPGVVVKPDQFKEINDEGMPMYQRPFMRGKLHIHFTVGFPDSLTPVTR